MSSTVWAIEHIRELTELDFSASFGFVGCAFATSFLVRTP